MDDRSQEINKAERSRTSSLSTEVGGAELPALPSRLKRFSLAEKRKEKKRKEKQKQKTTHW